MVPLFYIMIYLIEMGYQIERNNILGRIHNCLYIIEKCGVAPKEIINSSFFATIYFSLSYMTQSKIAIPLNEKYLRQRKKQRKRLIILCKY